MFGLGFTGLGPREISDIAGVEQGRTAGSYRISAHFRPPRGMSSDGGVAHPLVEPGALSHRSENLIRLASMPDWSQYSGWLL